MGKSDFELKGVSAQSVRLRLRAKDGSRFIMEVSSTGLNFYGDENDAGNSHSKAVHKSVDDIWEWVRDLGGPKPLKDRAQVKRARQSQSAPAEPPKKPSPRLGVRRGE